MSLSFSRYVCFIFHVCPVLSLQVISLHLPSCRLVSLCFVSFSLSLSCPFRFPFVSLAFPAAFLSCRLPISSPHFLALPCISPLLPSLSRKKARFVQRFRKEDVQKHRVFPEGGRKPKPAKGRLEPGTPVLAPRRLRLVECHQMTGGPPPTPLSDVGRGERGGLSSILFREQGRRILQGSWRTTQPLLSGKLKNPLDPR